MSRNMGSPPSGMGRLRRGEPGVKPKNMRGTLYRLWQMTEGSRKGLGWIFLLSGLASGSAIILPYLIGKIVSLIDDGSPAWQMIWILAAAYLGDWLVRFLQQYHMASLGQRMILHIRTNLFNYMKGLPLSFFDERQHGELMSRLTNDVDNISTTISGSLTQMIMYAFTIVGVFIVMVWMNFLLTAVVTVSVVFVYLLTKTITKRTRKLFREQQAILGKLNGQVEESISGLTMVKAFCREEAMVKEFIKNNDRFCEVAIKAQIWSGYLMPITNVINNVSYVLIAIISGIIASKGNLAIGTITSFLLYSRQFSRPFVDIANIYNNLQTAVAGAERIFEILDEEPEPEDVTEPVELTRPNGEIRFEGVSFGYLPGKTVLENVNLCIPSGTRVALVGPTGAGKTTIINLLTRFYDVNEGSILLDGHDLRQYRMKDLREAFGVVLQDTSLFGVSIGENISYGRTDISQDKVREAAKIAGAHSFISRLPQGYDTILTQGGSELSQGERQLLSIARAVLMDAPIMILDEATSSVDTVTEQQIRKAMLTLTEGRTSFIIAHRLSTIRDSDLIVLIKDGRIAEMGNHEQLMNKNGEYALMYKTQMGMT